MNASGLSLRGSSGAVDVTPRYTPPSMSTGGDFGRVGGRISSRMNSSPLDSALLWIGVIVGVAGLLMVFLFAANVSVDCVLSISVKDRAFDVCRVRQQSGWVAPGSYWMSHSRSVLVSGIERAVLIATYSGHEVIFGARSDSEFISRNDLVRLSPTAPGEEDDEEDDDHAVDEDILAHSKCLVGVEVTSGKVLSETVKLTLIPRPCLGHDAIQRLREVQEFIHRRQLPPEDKDILNADEPSMERFDLYEETGFVPQLVGFGLILLGGALVLLYNLGGIIWLASMFPK